MARMESFVCYILCLSTEFPTLVLHTLCTVSLAKIGDRGVITDIYV